MQRKILDGLKIREHAPGALDVHRAGELPSRLPRRWGDPYPA